MSDGLKITVFQGGPYVITGALDQLELVDGDGKAIASDSKKSVALCRCGASENKPFCDGAHKTCGFTG